MITYRDYVTRHDGIIERASLDKDSALGVAWTLGDQRAQLASDRIKQGSTKRKADTNFAVALFQKPQLNATATQLVDCYAISMFWPLVLSLQGVAAAIWANPLVAPWIGEVERISTVQTSNEIYPPGLELYLAHQDKILFEPSAFRSGVPIMYVDAIIEAGESRWELFLVTWKAALEFIWNHELAHILYGHVDLARSQFGVDMLYEGEGISRAFSSKALSQFMEYVADFDGALQIFASFYGTLLDKRSEFDLKIASQIGAATTLGIVLAMYVLHQGAVIQGKEQATATTHPPLLYRAHWILGAEAQALNETSVKSEAEKESVSDITQTVRRSINELLASVAQTHPSLNYWLGCINDDGETKTNTYLSSLHKKAEPWFDQLTTLQKV